MYGYDILCGTSKSTFEIPHKISQPCIEEYDFSYTIEILRVRALKSKRLYRFLKHPLDDVVCKCAHYGLAYVIYKPCSKLWVFFVVTDAICKYKVFLKGVDRI